MEHSLDMILDSSDSNVEESDGNEKIDKLKIYERNQDNSLQNQKIQESLNNIFIKYFQSGNTNL